MTDVAFELLWKATRMETDLRQAAEWLRSSQNLLVFTGAGISAESGIPTFRDEAGLWQTFPPEQFATWRGLAATALARPRRFADFLYAVIEPIAAAKPNAAHRVIAAAEQHIRVTVVTQNIDGLQQEAGSTVVHELHGSFCEIVGLSGRFRHLVSRRELRQAADGILRARRGMLTLPWTLLAVRKLAGIGLHGPYRPNLVLFGDAMAEPAWSNAVDAAEQTDCVLQIGCSGAVMPAAMIPLEAKAHGAKLVAVDPLEVEADIWLEGRAAEIVPRLFVEAFGPHY
jgi:NAD-dependent deacetylase